MEPHATDIGYGSGLHAVSVPSRPRYSVTARDLAKARGALASEFPLAAHGATVDMVETDLASLKDVRKAASEVLEQEETIRPDRRQCGVIVFRWGKTADGFKTEWGRERTEADCRVLLWSALRIAAVVPTTGPMSISESQPL